METASLVREEVSPNVVETAAAAAAASNKRPEGMKAHRRIIHSRFICE